MNLPVIGWAFSILAVANLGQCAALRHYKAKSELCAVQCVADAQRAAAEGERLATAAVEARMAVKLTELEARLSQEAESNRRLAELAQSEAAAKVAIQRRLNNALRNQDNLDWWDTPVPVGLLDATRSDGPEDRGGAGADPVHPAAARGANALRAAGVPDHHQWRLAHSLASRESGGP